MNFFLFKFFLFLLALMFFFFFVVQWWWCLSDFSWVARLARLAEVWKFWTKKTTQNEVLTISRIDGLQNRSVGNSSNDSNNTQVLTTRYAREISETVKKQGKGNGGAFGASSPTSAMYKCGHGYRFYFIDAVAIKLYKNLLMFQQLLHISRCLFSFY